VISVLPIPDFPTLNGATGVSADSFTASWDEVAGATSYHVDVSLNEYFSPNLLGFDNRFVPGTSETITGLQQNTSYYVRVRATNSSGSSINSNVVSLLTRPWGPFAQPANPVLSEVFIANWGSVLGVNSYSIDVSTSEYFTSYFMGYQNMQTSNTEYTIVGTSPGTRYYYRVRAENSSGASTNSNVIEVITLPEPPSGLTATNITDNSFWAGWNAPIGASEYRVDLATNSLFTDYVPGYENLLVPGTSVQISNLPQPTNQITYFFRVRAVNVSGISANSSPLAVLNLRSWILSPNGGEEFSASANLDLSINYAIYNPPDIAVELFDGSTRIFPAQGQPPYISESIPASGIQECEACKVRVYFVNDPINEDWSDGTFRITPDHNYIKSTTIRVNGIQTAKQSHINFSMGWAVRIKPCLCSGLL
jgi:hypothetical protein